MEQKILVEEETPNMVRTPVKALRNSEYDKFTEMQDFVYHAYVNDDDSCLFIDSPTASGKTLAISAPIFEKKTPVCFIDVYRALIDDQHRQLTEIGSSFGLSKDDFFYVRGGIPTRLVVEAVRSGKNLLATPDKLVSILRSNKRVETVLGFSILSRYDFVVDEVHVYNPLMLHSLVYFLRTLHRLGKQPRMHFLSATFTEVHRELLQSELERMGAKIVEIPKKMKVGMTGQVEVTVKPWKRNPKFIVNDIPGSNTVVVMNTAKKAWEIHSLLMARNVNSLLYVGQEKMSQKSREANFKKFTENPEKNVLSGSTALECGIDYKVRQVVTEEADAASVLQRFGRAGRRWRKGYVLIYSNELNFAGEKISRRSFEKEVWTQLEEEQPQDFYAALAAYPYITFLEGDLSIIDKSQVKKWCEDLIEAKTPGLFVRGYEPSLRYFDSEESMSFRTLCWKRFDLIQDKERWYVTGTPNPDRFFYTPSRQTAILVEPLEPIIREFRDGRYYIFGRFRFYIAGNKMDEWCFLEVGDDLPRGDNLIFRVNGVEKSKGAKFYGSDL